MLIKIDMPLNVRGITALRATYSKWTPSSASALRTQLHKLDV
jgi:hypothetical protein